jgi:hypothetical protein
MISHDLRVGGLGADAVSVSVNAREGRKRFEQRFNRQAINASSFVVVVDDG